MHLESFHCAMTVPECIYGGINMDDMEVTYYDAHVKAHERYILLQWLEDAKTEKIKKLKEEPIATPTKKIDVPSPDITEEAISYSQVFDNPNLDVSSRLIAEKPLKVVPYMPSINPIAIPGIITNKTEVPERIGEYKITITSQMFSDIKIADIPVSNHQIPTQTTIDTNAFSGIKSIKTKIPEHSDLSKAFTIPESFSIDLYETSIPTMVKIDEESNIDNDLFDSIKLAQPLISSVVIPTTFLLNNSLFTGFLPKTSFDTETPDNKKLRFNASLIHSISLRTISVPEQPKKTDIHINSELPSVISSVPVIPRKTVFETQSSIECSNNPSLPIVSIPEPMTVGTIDPSLINNPTFEDIKLPIQSEIHDSIADIEMPAVELEDYTVPEKTHIPELETDAVSTFTAPKVIISTASVKISSDIKNPQNTELPKVCIAETPNLHIAKPTEVSISTPQVPITNRMAKSVSELSFSLPKIAISGIKTTIPNNNDILEILEKEINMQNNS